MLDPGGRFGRSALLARIIIERLQIDVERVIFDRDLVAVRHFLRLLKHVAVDPGLGLSGGVLNGPAALPARRENGMNQIDPHIGQVNTAPGLRTNVDWLALEGEIKYDVVQFLDQDPHSCLLQAPAQSRARRRSETTQLPRSLFIVYHAARDMRTALEQDYGKANIVAGTQP